MVHIGDIWGVYVTKKVWAKSGDEVGRKQINRALPG